MLKLGEGRPQAEMLPKVKLEPPGAVIPLETLKSSDKSTLRAEEA